MTPGEFIGLLLTYSAFIIGWAVMVLASIGALTELWVWVRRKIDKARSIPGAETDLRDHDDEPKR